VTVLLWLLVALSVGLGLALYRTTRRIAVLTEANQTSVALHQSLPAPPTADGIETLRLRAAAEAVPVGIVITNERSEQVFVNESAAAATVPPNGVLAIRLRELLDAATNSQTRIGHDVELYSPVSRTVRLQATPLFEDGVRRGTMAFIEDLTDRLRVDSMRRDFIANASHELKTPLGALRLLAEALVASDDADVRAKLGSRIESEAARLTRLVDDILDLALIEEDLGDLVEVDLSAVVSEAVAQTKLLADTLGLAVEQSLAVVIVAGDHRSLVSAVANLIENALIYTRAKGPEVSAPVEVSVKRSNGQAVVEVQDHGLGIPERHQDRIFERFYRVDQGRGRASGGTGLGLAIVRHVVQNHGGRVEVESVPGAGAIFRLLLPTSDA